MPKMREEKDSVITRIKYKVKHLPTSTALKPIIDRVDHNIRQVNERDYEPELVSIGPIHRGKDHVESMEQHKFRYLSQLLDRKGGLFVEELVLEMRNLEEKARSCYPASIGLDQDEFVEMMLVDGCFVIELIRSYFFGDMRGCNEHNLQFSRTLNQVRHDLMLLENQLPFFVLNKLYNMTKMEDPEDNICRRTLFIVDDLFPWSEKFKSHQIPDISDNADHLLGLVYHFCFSYSFKYFTKMRGHRQNSFVYISSASELEKAGIRLKGCEELWETSFANGVVKLPMLNVSDKTESILRNLIAYEQCFLNDHPRCVTDYAFLLHCLNRSTKDVEILRRNGIISNFLGSDEMICLMINRLGKNVGISSDFCYSNVVAGVERYCRTRRRSWVTKLRKYLNNSWPIMSFLGGVILLLLTFIQTVFYVLYCRR